MRSVLRFIEACASPEGEVALSQKTGTMVVSRRTALAGAASWTLAAAAGARALAQSPGEPIPCATAPNDSSGPMFYATELGYYKQAGLNISLQLLANSGSIPTGLASGAYAIVGMPVTLVALAREKGIPMVMIAPCSLYVSTTPDHAIVVPKNSPLRKASDLNGKTIAVRDFNNMSHLAARAWLDKNGGDSKSVSFVEIPNPEQLDALASKRIDAACLVEPFISSVKGDVRFIGRPYDSLGKQIMTFGWIANKTWYDANPALVKATIAALRDTARWANRNPAATAAINAKYSKVPVDQITSQNRQQFADGKLDPRLIQPIIDASARYGFLPQQFAAADLFAPGL
jgi:NitT/TauT family transport system substrate-binding protein